MRVYPMDQIPSSSFGLTEIGQIAVPVKDVGRAVAFYREVLGMRFLFQPPRARLLRLRRRSADAR